MKWKAITRQKYDEGYERIKTRFLFFPKRVNDEWRWLEKASWMQSYEYLYTDVQGEESKDVYRFIDLCWVDPTKGEIVDGHFRRF